MEMPNACKQILSFRFDDLVEIHSETETNDGSLKEELGQSIAVDVIRMSQRRSVACRTRE